MRNKTLDIGNSDFKDLIENDSYFVDKTLFIKEVIDSDHKVMLIARPRRFGKTLNLSMLKYFFDINEKDNNLFENFKIWQEGQKYTSKRGKYPVIFLTFKDVKKSTWQDTVEDFTILLSKLYAEFDYLLDSDLLKKRDKKIFEKILNEEAKQSEYENALKDLTEYLYKYHKQKVVILIDEYDTPIHTAYLNGFYDEVISFMRNLMSGAFKDNKYIYKGVVTGILRVSKESIFSGLNNMGIYTIFNYQFSDKFGFTEEETKQMLEDFAQATKYDKVKQWYGGYKFGNTKNLFNPWSITNFIAFRKEGLKPYWINTSSDDFIKERITERNADETRTLIEKLIGGETIRKKIYETFVFTDFKKNKELFWTLLVYSGYLISDGQDRYRRHKLSIPNQEVKILFQDIILEWLSSELNIEGDLLYSMANYLVSNKIKKFEETFKKVMSDTLSYFDFDKEPERVYQAYVLGLLAILSDDYIIKSNRESGEGRYDILLLPYDKTKYGILMEIKVLDKHSSAEEIQAKLQQALNQISEKEYYTELLNHKIEKRLEIAIVFVGKKIYLKHREVHGEV